MGKMPQNPSRHARSILAMSGKIGKDKGKKFCENLKHLKIVVPMLQKAADQLEVPFNSISGRLGGSDDIVSGAQQFLSSVSSVMRIARPEMSEESINGLHKDRMIEFDMHFPDRIPILDKTVNVLQPRSEDSAIEIHEIPIILPLQSTALILDNDDDTAFPIPLDEDQLGMDPSNEAVQESDKSIEANQHNAPLDQQLPKDDILEQPNEAVDKSLANHLLEPEHLGANWDNYDDVFGQEFLDIAILDRQIPNDDTTESQEIKNLLNEDVYENPVNYLPEVEQLEANWDNYDDVFTVLGQLPYINQGREEDFLAALDLYRISEANLLANPKNPLLELALDSTQLEMNLLGE